MKAHPRKIFARATTGVIALSVCMALMSVILSCKSGPDEATQWALKDAQDKTERAREQAMDFGGATYAADEWNAAETLYTAAKDLPLVTMKDYEAAIPQFDDIFNNYMDVFYKAAPQYVEARKSLIASKRQEAVDAGAETYLAQELAAVDEQDKNSLSLYANNDYYGYQAASFDVEKRYGLLQTEATALSLKDEIVANKFDRFDPDALGAADESFTAAKTAYAANDLDAAQSAANDALAKYQQVLSNGWKSYAGEQQPRAEAARADAVAVHADVVLKDDFDAADAVYNQGADDYGAESYQEAADAFVKVQPMFAALAKTAGAQQKNAATALQTAQKVVAASQKKAAALPETANNEFLAKADKLLASSQSSLDAGDYAGSVASAAEAQKNAGLSDAYVTQQQKMKAANEALAAAKKQMDGVTPDAQKKYAPLYNTATAAYADALNAQKAKNWDTVATDAKKITAAVAAIAKAKSADDAAEKKASDAASAALAAAKKRLDAVSADTRRQFVDQYGTASSAYNDAAKAQGAKDWNAVTANVKRVNDALDQLDKAVAAALAAAEARRKAEEAALAVAEKKTSDAASAALAAAKKRLDGVTAEIRRQFVDQYGTASSAYDDAAKAQGAKDWNAVTANVKRMNDALDQLEKAAVAALAAAEARRKAEEAALAAAEKKASDAANAALVAAKKRLDGVSADDRREYAGQYGTASSAYNDATKAQGAKDWNAVTANVKRVNDALDQLEKAAVAAFAAAEARRKAEEAALAAAEKKASDAANAALVAAKKRLDGVGADARREYADQYGTASSAYNDAAKAQGAKDWNAVTANVKRVNDALDQLDKAMALAVAEARRKAAEEAALAAAEKKASDAANAALVAAKKRLDGVGADARREYADQYGTASSAYDDAANAQNAKDWNAVTANVKRVNDALDQLDRVAALAAAEARRKAAEEAARLAAEKQQADAATAALAAAKDRLDWAAGIGAAEQYPDPYEQAESAYNDGENALAAQDWDQASADAQTVVTIVDGIEAQKSGEADDAMSIAKERLDWAEGVNAEENYPDNFAQATNSYAEGVDALEEKDWNAAILAADDVMSALASISVEPTPSPLPARYTVKSWETTRDCLWNIAAYPWVYNDPFQWRRLYEANREKLPNPDDSDRIEIGTVIDIPSIFGEVREGLWEEGKVYEPLVRE